MKGNVLIMAGGTGGHVIPALSVASELKAQGYKVHWLGSVQGIENDLVPDAGYPLHQISVSGLRGKGLIKTLFAPLLLVNSCWQAFKVVREVKPVLVVGMGGFASGPGGLVAALLKLPLVIHEQNAIPGMTNNLLSRWASKVLQAFDGTFSVSKKPITVGNPVRKSIAALPEPEHCEETRPSEHQRLRVLVVGGSLGAVAINELVIETINKMPEEERPEIWHQTGKRNFESVKQGYETRQLDARVSAFIADMAEAYLWADVVVCRSGALTVSELMAAGVPSILIPFPHAVDDHQTANGQFLVNAGAAWLRPQAEYTAEKMIEDFRALTQSKTARINMATAARTLAKPEAAKRVAKICIEAIHG